MYQPGVVSTLFQKTVRRSSFVSPLTLTLSSPTPRSLRTSPLIPFRFNPQPAPKVKLHTKLRDSYLLLEAQQGPLGKTVAGIGQAVITGTLIFSSGSLLYYTLFDQNEGQDETVLGSGPYPQGPRSLQFQLPEYARDRVRTTYTYMFHSLGVSMLGAFASFRIFQNPRLFHPISAHPMLAILIAMAAQFSMTMLTRAVPYKEDGGFFQAKQACSFLQATLIGLSAAPLYLLGAQSVVRAGFVTAGVLAGLTGVSGVIPHDALTSWDAPLRVGMAVVFLAFLALWFIPKSHRLYNRIYRTAMHGGLCVFPAYYLYNSKAVIQSAVMSKKFDPINASMPMYTDILNIYGRLAFLLPPYYLIQRMPRKKD